jgi:DNA polymerase-1
VGGYILDADYSQIELRIAGLLSGDEAFLDIYQQGKDVHLLSGDLLTQACLGKPAGWLLDQYERVGKDEEPVRTWRQIGKTANFLVIYEGQSFKLCMTVRNDTGYEMSQPAAAEFIYSYDQRHRGLRQWQEELVQTAINKGFIELPFGWSRMFLGGRATADEERATICNFPVQATAALLLESAQARIIQEIAYRGLHSRCDKNVYDSIRIDCQPTELPVMREILNKWLTRPPLLEYLEGVLGRSIPITHDLKTTRVQ